MIYERQHGYYRIYLLILAVSAAVLFTAWSHAFDWMTGKHIYRQTPILICATVQSGVFFLYGIIHSRWEAFLIGRDRRARLMMGLRQAALMILSMLVFFVATKKTTFVSRSFLFSYFPLLTFSLVFLNAVIPGMISRLLFVGMSSEGALLVSPDETAASRSLDVERLMEWVHSQRYYGIVVHGVLGPSQSMSKRCGLPYLGELSLLRHVLAETGSRSIFLTHLPEDLGQMKEMISLCEENAVRFSTILDLQARVGRPVHLLNSNGMQLLVVRREPLENPFRRIAKRAFDILFSVLVITIVLPPMALVTSIMQAFQSPGPLFFRQCRSGHRNTPFWIFKFRTMHHADEGDESRQAVVDDSRIFPFGSVLRRTSLDELPQFLNVLRGEMSVVGPRPHLKIHNETWEKFLKPYHLRALVKPGVTGLAQVRGLRGEASSEHEIRRRVECDIEYLETWTFLLDLWIVMVTSVQVLFPLRKAR